jgi:hypothetical protein
LEGLSKEDVGLFYGHLVYFKAIRSIFWLFRIGIFSRFGMLYKEKSGKPAEYGGFYVRFRKFFPFDSVVTLEQVLAQS